jgi:hypothetical protein
MRTMRPSFLLLAVAPALMLAQTVSASDRATAPPSAANVVRLHPHAWHFNVPSRAAMRFEPEAGEPAEVAATTGTSDLARTTDQARARSLASQSVRTAADGSRSSRTAGSQRTACRPRPRRRRSWRRPRSSR